MEPAPALAQPASKPRLAYAMQPASGGGQRIHESRRSGFASRLKILRTIGSKNSSGRLP